MALPIPKISSGGSTGGLINPSNGPSEDNPIALPKGYPLMPSIGRGDIWVATYSNLIKEKPVQDYYGEMHSMADIEEWTLHYDGTTKIWSEMHTIKGDTTITQWTAQSQSTYP